MIFWKDKVNNMEKYYVFENGEHISEWANFDDAMQDAKHYAMEAVMCMNETDEFQYYEYVIAEVINGSTKILNKIVVNCEKV